MLVTLLPPHRPGSPSPPCPLRARHGRCTRPRPACLTLPAWLGPWWHRLHQITLCWGQHNRCPQPLAGKRAFSRRTAKHAPRPSTLKHSQTTQLQATRSCRRAHAAAAAAAAAGAWQRARARLHAAVLRRGPGRGSCRGCRRAVGARRCCGPGALFSGTPPPARGTGPGSPRAERQTWP